MLEELCTHEKYKKLFVFSRNGAVYSKSFRRRLIGSLDIPTFGGFQKVMFYDVLIQLGYRGFKIEHNKKIYKKKFVLLKMENKLLMSQGLTKS